MKRNFIKHWLHIKQFKRRALGRVREKGNLLKWIKIIVLAGVGLATAMFIIILAIVLPSLPDVENIENIEASGASKKKAEKEAARKMLAIIKETII